ncbi:MAG: hypothetical protein LC732_08040, partial [Acidobacteria bacterium]|nr:hypothetical protein [Acidobacteriota bacterium]
MLRALNDAVHHGKRREEIETYNRLLDRDDLTPGGRALILTLRGQSKALLASIEGGIELRHAVIS